MMTLQMTAVTINPVCPDLLLLQLLLGGPSSSLQEKHQSHQPCKALYQDCAIFSDSAEDTMTQGRLNLLMLPFVLSSHHPCCNAHSQPYKILAAVPAILDIHTPSSKSAEPFLFIIT